MAGNAQINVGLSFSMDGVENVNEFTNQIQEIVNNVNRILSKLTVNLDIDVSKFARLQQMFEMFNDVISRLREMFDSNKSIKVMISKASIRRIKQELGEVLNEVLSKIPLNQVVASATAAKAKSKASRASVDGGDTAFEDLASIANLDNQLRTYFQSLDNIIGRLSKNSQEQVQRLESQLGKTVRSGLVTFETEASKEFDRSVQDLQRRALESARQIDKIFKSIDAAEIRGDKTFELQEGFAPSIENARKILENLRGENDKLIKNAEVYRRVTLDQIATSKQALRVEDKRAARLSNINLLFTQGRNVLQGLLTEQDPAKVARFTQQFEKLGLQITADIKDMQSLSNRYTANIRKIDFELARLRANNEDLNLVILDPSKSEQERRNAEVLLKSNNSLIESYVSMREARSNANKSLEQDIDSFINYGAEVRHVIQQLRSLSREYEEFDKIIERVGRNNTRLAFSNNVVLSTLKDVTAQLPRIDDSAGFDVTRRALNAVNNNVIQLKNNLTQLQEARTGALAALKRDFQAQEGLFKINVENRTDKEVAADIQAAKVQYDQIVNAINARYDALESNTLQNLDRLGSAEVEAARIAIESNEKVKKSYDRIGNSIESLARKQRVALTDLNDARSRFGLDQIGAAKARLAPTSTPQQNIVPNDVTVRVDLAKRSLNALSTAISNNQGKSVTFLSSMSKAIMKNAYSFDVMANATSDATRSVVTDIKKVETTAATVENIGKMIELGFIPSFKKWSESSSKESKRVRLSISDVVSFIETSADRVNALSESLSSSRANVGQSIFEFIVMKADAAADRVLDLQDTLNSSKQALGETVFGLIKRNADAAVDSIIDLGESFDNNLAVAIDGFKSRIASLRNFDATPFATGVIDSFIQRLDRASSAIRDIDFNTFKFKIGSVGTGFADALQSRLDSLNKFSRGVKVSLDVTNGILSDRLSDLRDTARTKLKPVVDVFRGETFSGIRDFITRPFVQAASDILKIKFPNTRFLDELSAPFASQLENKPKLLGFDPNVVTRQVQQLGSAVEDVIRISDPSRAGRGMLSGIFEPLRKVPVASDETKLLGFDPNVVTRQVQQLEGAVEDVLKTSDPSRAGRGILSGIVEPLRKALVVSGETRMALDDLFSSSGRTTKLLTFDPNVVNQIEQVEDSIQSLGTGFASSKVVASIISSFVDPFRQAQVVIRTTAAEIEKVQNVAVDSSGELLKVESESSIRTRLNSYVGTILDVLRESKTNVSTEVRTLSRLLVDGFNTIDLRETVKGIFLDIPKSALQPLIDRVSEGASELNKQLRTINVSDTLKGVFFDIPDTVFSPLERKLSESVAFVEKQLRTINVSDTLKGVFFDIPDTVFSPLERKLSESITGVKEQLKTIDVSSVLRGVFVDVPTGALSTLKNQAVGFLQAFRDDSISKFKTGLDDNIRTVKLFGSVMKLEGEQSVSEFKKGIGDNVSTLKLFGSVMRMEGKESASDFKDGISDNVSNLKLFTSVLGGLAKNSVSNFITGLSDNVSTLKLFGSVMRMEGRESASEFKTGLQDNISTLKLFGSVMRLEAKQSASDFRDGLQDNISTLKLFGSVMRLESKEAASEFVYNIGSIVEFIRDLKFEDIRKKLSDVFDVNADKAIASISESRDKVVSSIEAMSSRLKILRDDIEAVGLRTFLLNSAMAKLPETTRQFLTSISSIDIKGAFNERIESIRSFGNSLEEMSVKAFLSFEKLKSNIRSSSESFELLKARGFLALLDVKDSIEAIGPAFERFKTRGFLAFDSFSRGALDNLQKVEDGYKNFRDGMNDAAKNAGDAFARFETRSAFAIKAILDSTDVLISRISTISFKTIFSNIASGFAKVRDAFRSPAIIETESKKDSVDSPTTSEPKRSPLTTDELVDIQDTLNTVKAQFKSINQEIKKTRAEIQDAFQVGNQELAQFIRLASSSELSNLPIEDQLVKSAQLVEVLRNDFKLSSEEAKRFADGLIRGDGALENATEAATKLYSQIRDIAQLQDQIGSAQQIDRAFRIDGIGSLKGAVELIKKARTDVEKLAIDFDRSELVLEQAISNLAVGGEATLTAISDIKKIGGESKSAVAALEKIIFAYNRLKQAGIELSAADEQVLADAKNQVRVFKERAVVIDSQTQELSKLEKQTRRNGKRLQLYNEGLADSIIQSLSFVNALTIVSSVIFALRSGFTQLIEQSKILSRVYTVVRSETESFEKATQRVSEAVRETAIAFGETVETTAEVVKQLGSAGFSAETALSALVPVMQLVVGTQANAEQATRTVAGVYRVFGSELSETGSSLEAFTTIADVLTSVYRNHQAELDEINQGLRFSAAAAKAAGVSFQDLSAFLAVLNDNLIKSGAAGRGLQVIFAQFAAKSKQIEQAFGIEAIDKSLPLSEQFIGVLEQINKRYREGALSVRDLDKTFKIFGLRGARSFITLVKQFDDVNLALDEMRNKAKGTGQELSNIVRASLAKEFESAKQSLLELARLLLEPARDIVVFVSRSAEAIRSLADAGGILTKIISTTLGVIAVIAFLGQSLYALARIATVVGVEFQYITGLLKLNTTETAINSAVVQENAVAHAQNAAATNVDAAAQSRLATGVGRLKTALSGLGAVGKGFVFAGALVLAGIAFAALTKTSRDLRKELAGISSEVGKIQKDLAGLDSFAKELDRIGDRINSSGVATERAGQEVVNAFNKVGSDVISQGDIVIRTNKQIADSFDQIAAAAKRQIAVARVAKKLELERKQQLLDENVLAQVVTTGEFAKNQIVGSNKIDAVLSGQKQFTVGRNGLLGGVFNFDITEETKKDVDAQLKDLRDRLILAQQQLLGAGFSEAEVKKRLDFYFGVIQVEYGKRASDFVRKAVDAELSRELNKALFNEIEAPNILDSTFGNLAVVIEKIDGPIGSAAFDSIVSGLDDVKARAEASEKTFKDLEAGVFALRRARGQFGVNKNEFFDVTDLPGVQGKDQILKLKDIEISFDTDTFNKAIQRSIKSIPKKNFESIQSAFQASVGGRRGTEIGKSLREVLEYSNQLKKLDKGSQEYRNTVDKMNAAQALFTSALSSGIDEAGNLTFKGEELSEALISISNESGNAEQSLKQFVSALKSGKITEDLQGANDEFEKLVRGIKSASFARTALNDITARDNDIERLRELRITYNKTGRDIESLSRDLASYLEQQKTLINFLERNRDASDNATKQAKEELGIVEKKIGVLKKTLDVTADEIRKKKELRIVLLKNTNEFRRQSRILEQQATNLKGGVSILSQRLATQKENVSLKIEELKAEEKIFGALRNSKAALNEILGLTIEVVNTYNEYLDALSQEATDRFGILSDIEKLLDRTNKLAGAEFEILNAIKEVERINGRILNLSVDLTEDISERTKLYRQLVDAVKPLFDIEKKLLENEDKLNNAADKRIEILKSIRDEYQKNATTAGASLKKIIERQLQLDPRGTVFKIAKDLGVAFDQVNFDKTRFVEEYVKAIEQGRLGTSRFAAEFGSLFTQLRTAGQETRDYNDAVVELSKRSQAFALASFRKFVILDKLDEAQKALDLFRSRIDEVAGKDSKVKIELEQQALVRQEELFRLLQARKEKLELVLTIIGGNDYFTFLANIKERLRAIKEELISINNLDNSAATQTLKKDIPGIAKGTKGSVVPTRFTTEKGLADIQLRMKAFAKTIGEADGILKRFQNSGSKKEQAATRKVRNDLARIMNEVLNSLPTSQTPVKFNTGGSVGDMTYGGGDRIPALLEAGEYVIPKRIVDKLGVDYFETLRSGRLPGFFQGGSVNSASGIPFVSGSTSGLDSSRRLQQRIEKSVEGVAGATTKVEKELEDFSENLVAYNKVLQRASRGLTVAEQKQAVDAGKPTVTRNEAFKKDVEDGLKIIQSSPILSSIFEDLDKALDDSFGAIQTFLQGMLVPEFAKANVEVYKSFLSSLRGIREAYADQLDTAQMSLKKNQSSYFAYLDSIEGAERQRIKSRLDAEKQYQDQLKKTAEVFEQSFRTNFDSIVKTASSSISSVLGGLSDSIFGDPKDRLKAIVSGIKDIFSALTDEFKKFFKTEASNLFSGVGEGFKSFFKDPSGFVDSLSSAISALDSSNGKAGAPGILANLGGLLGGVIGQGVSAGIGGIGQLLSGLVSVTSGDNFGGKTVAFIEKFARELPQSADRFTDKLIENSDRILTAVAQAAPKVIDVFVAEAPRFLESFVGILDENLPKILESVARGLPKLIQGIVPQIIKLLGTIVEQIPVILGGIIESIPVLIAEIIKALPGLLVSVIKAVIKGVLEVIKGLLKGFGSVLGVFHDGGVIGPQTQGSLKRADEVMIIAQKGEGVLSRRGMAALGGADRLNALNNGEALGEQLPVYHDGGMVGTYGVRQMPLDSSRNASYNTSNNFSTNVYMSGGDSDDEIRRKSKIAVDTMEVELARRVADRNSRLARALR